MRKFYKYKVLQCLYSIYDATNEIYHINSTNIQVLRCLYSIYGATNEKYHIYDIFALTYKVGDYAKIGANVFVYLRFKIITMNVSIVKIRI